MQRLDPIEAVDRAIARIGALDDAVKAFVTVDAELALADARTDTAGGSLGGLTFGVKDIFATGDRPTQYGSSIYAGFRPRGDAAIVAELRAAGALCMGKTVTTEFALSFPGPTRNPHRLDHTPGGSSSGSAAAVASGMVDFAIGSQTAGSVIRPASFCGVFGYKPTFGTVPIAGMKPVAPSLDTPGFFARDAWLLDRVRVVLTGRPEAAPLTRPPRLGVARHQPDRLTADVNVALNTAVQRATAAGAQVTELVEPSEHDELIERHDLVMAYEAVRSLSWEYRNHRGALSGELLRRLDAGAAVDPQAYDELLMIARRSRDDLDRYLGSVDAVITAAAPGEAPQGLDSTGDSRFCRLWTILGTPALSVPGATGASGLPVGIQVIARPFADATAIAVAAWLYPVLTGIEALDPVQPTRSTSHGG